MDRINSKTTASDAIRIFNEEREEEKRVSRILDNQSQPLASVPVENQGAVEAPDAVEGLVAQGYGRTWDLASPMKELFDQQVNTKWYYPLYGSDSLQHVIDAAMESLSALQAERNVLRETLAGVTRELDELLCVMPRAIDNLKGNFEIRVAPSLKAIKEARAALATDSPKGEERVSDFRCDSCGQVRSGSTLADENSFVCRGCLGTEGTPID